MQKNLDQDEKDYIKDRFKGLKIKTQVPTKHQQDLREILDPGFSDTTDKKFFFEIDFNMVIKANSVGKLRVNPRIFSHQAFLNTIAPYSILYFSNATDSKTLFIPQVLIDADYPKEQIMFYLVNNSTVDISVQKHYISVLAYAKVVPSVPLTILYDAPFFDFINTDNSSILDNINNFFISTPGANALDIVFEKEYTIQPKGIVELFLPVLYDYHYRPFTFIMRSRFAIQGIVLTFLSINELTLKITLINTANNSIDLGHRFLSFSPESRLAINLDSNILPIFGIKVYRGSNIKIPIVYQDNVLRKIKQ